MHPVCQWCAIICFSFKGNSSLNYQCVWSSSTDVRMYVALSQYNVSVNYISNIKMTMYATLNYPLFVLLAASSTFKIKTYTTPTLYYFTFFFGKWDCSHLLLLNLGLFSFSYLVIYRVKWDGVELRAYIYAYFWYIYEFSVTRIYFRQVQYKCVISAAVTTVNNSCLFVSRGFSAILCLLIWSMNWIKLSRSIQWIARGTEIIKSKLQVILYQATLIV